MSAILPPSERVWWKQPLDRVELIWIVIALVWCLIMFFMMPYWHVYGKQNLANEAYRTTPAVFMKKTEAMVAKYKVREEGGALKVPVVAPPAGRFAVVEVLVNLHQRQTCPVAAKAANPRMDVVVYWMQSKIQ